MEKKYILTDETKIVLGHTLHRIQAVKDFGDVWEGDLGGWIEKEENLSHEGTCWVDNEALVYKEAVVYGKAKVCGEAEVSEKARVYEGAVVYGNALLYGEAQVFGEAKVCAEAHIYGKARVYENARICGKAVVFGEAEVFEEAQIYIPIYVGQNAYISSQKDVKVIGPIGSRSGSTTFARSKDNDILAFCGCFKGTIDEFESKVREVHKGTEYEKEYLNAIEYARKEFSM